MPEHIDPDAIPGKDLDPATIREQANAMRTIGNSIGENGVQLVRAWGGLSEHYVAPEAETLFAVMDPVSTTAQAVAADVATARDALVAFADEVEPIKAELDRLRTEAREFVADIAGGVQVEVPNPAYTAPGTTYAAGYNPYAGGATGSDFQPTITETREWHEDQASVDRNNELIAAVNEQAVLLWAAERKCANAIYDIIGHPHIEAATDENPDGYGVEEIPEGAETPWGQPVEKTESCGESVVSGVKSFVWDGIIVGGIWGTIEGLGTLTLGYNPATGDFFSGDAYAAAWSNLGMLAVGLAANTGPLMGAKFLPGPVGDFFRSADEAVINAGKGLIAWDQWSEDPAAAAGTSVFNIATIIIPAGAAVSGVKAGASTASAAIRATAAVMDVIDPASLVVRAGGAGIRVAAPAISDLMSSLDLSSLTRGADLPSFTVPHVDLPASSVDIPTNSFDVPPVRDLPPVREPELVGAGAPHPVNSVGGAAPSPSPSAGGGAGAGLADPLPTHPGGPAHPEAPAGGSGTSGDPASPAGSGSPGDAAPPAEVPPSGGADPVPPREWTPEDGDPALSDADYGDSWTRGPDHRGDPVDPGYGQPRADHGSLNPMFDPPATIPDDVAHLVRDPDAPFGRDETGRPYSRSEWEERYVGPDNRPIYPGNDGAVAGSRIEFDDLDAFQAHYGDLLDRMGGDGGDFFSFPDTPFEHRALPGSNLSAPYWTLRVTELPPGFRIEVSEIAPAFGQPGGGLQVRIIDEAGNPVPMDVLVDSGIARVVDPDAPLTPGHVFEEPPAHDGLADDPGSPSRPDDDAAGVGAADDAGAGWPEGDLDGAADAGGSHADGAVPASADDPIVWENTEEGVSLTASQKAAADEYLATSASIEPRLSELMRDLEARHGATLEGFDFRLKTEDSFYRKLATAIQNEPGTSLDELLGDMKDSVRYTFTIDGARYTESATEIMHALEAQGLEPYGTLKNTWGSEGYQGINSNWVDPSGRIIEVQIHTPESFAAKQVTHDWYDVIRAPGSDPAVVADLIRRQDEIFADVPRPDGATDLTWESVLGDAARPAPDADTGANISDLATPVRGTTEQQFAIHAGSAEPAVLKSIFRREYPDLIPINAERFANEVDGYRNNCTRCVVVADEVLAGGSPSKAEAVFGNGDSPAYVTERLGGSWRQMTSYGSIVDWMKRWGEGSRGVVYIDRGVGDPPAHVFTVVHDKNGVVFLDAQTGSFAKLEEFKYLFLLRTAKGTP